MAKNADKEPKGNDEQVSSPKPTETAKPKEELKKKITAQMYAEIHGFTATNRFAVEKIYGSELKNESEWKIALKDFVTNK